MKSVIAGFAGLVGASLLALPASAMSVPAAGATLGAPSVETVQYRDGGYYHHRRDWHRPYYDHHRYHRHGVRIGPVVIR